MKRLRGSKPSYRAEMARRKLAVMECARCGVRYSVHHKAGSWGEPCGPTHTHFAFPEEWSSLQREGTGLANPDQRKE